MSRIGKMQVPIPKGVEVKESKGHLTVKGPKGELALDVHQDMKVVVEDGEIRVERPSDQKHHRALHGLTRSLVANMVQGVSEGFSKELTLVGVGYRAALKGKEIELQVGFSHPVSIPAEEGITFEVPEPTKIVISGIDKQKVGQVAADIRSVRPPEPYKGKGIRYTDEYVRRKAGKAGVTG